MPVPTVSSEPFGFEAWCQKELSRLLNFSVGEDLISYLVSMETAEEAEEYLTELLGKDTPPVIRFRREFLRRWRPPERPPQDPTPEEAGLLEALVRPKQEELVLFSQEGHQKGNVKKDASSVPAPPPGFSAAHRTSKNRSNPPIRSHHPASTNSPSPEIQRRHNTAPQGAQSVPYATPPSTSLDKKHRQKYVPLMSAEGRSKTSVHLPGRHPCQCLAQRHTLVNNCTECGRIVCSQEGTGPCLFCGALVCTPEEEELLARDSKKAQKFKDQILKQFQIKDGSRAFDHIQPMEATVKLSKAVEHKEKLLEFDQASVRQTKVIDDESDYFSVDANRWLSTQEKVGLHKKEEELREKRHGSRRNRAITLDIAGRRVIEDDPRTETYGEEGFLGGYEAGKRAPTETATAGSLCNPAIPIDPPKFVETQKPKNDADPGRVTEPPPRPSPMRLQDRALQEMGDRGQCLSMHQPWASLLVTGVKRAEGRTWYAVHRGRLWIAAAAQQPTPDEIQAAEDLYRRLYGENEVWFPSDYPVGCLLGCVDMVDCLPQDEYRQQVR